MRAAVVSDVHGNLPALEAVLADVDRERVDVVVSCGDLVWGPFPAECLELLRARGTRFVRGNCDRLVLDAPPDDEHRWSLERLTEPQRREIAAWPTTLELDVDGLGRVLFCHASPRSDEEPLSAAALAGLAADGVVYGHTHRQRDERVDGIRAVNPGSVGVPDEARAGAYWAILGPRVELRRTVYDFAEAAERLRATGFPRDRLEPVLSRLRR